MKIFGILVDPFEAFVNGIFVFFILHNLDPR